MKEVKTSVAGWLVPKTYYCTNEECGYSGPVFIEIDADELEEFQRVLRAESSHQTR